ncbi:MAG: hypothetical protein GEV09_18815 [Pseudonocardiaceae bacterium]|nr:hypothetical protein [Pseudonocardiaceae bacterium]
MTSTSPDAAAEVDADVSTGPISAPVVAALETAWATIRARHPEVPAVVIVLGAGSGGAAAGGIKLGHFAALRWHHHGERLPEVFVGGEGLARGAGEVLATLLHEAAHALAHVRGIQDTSRQGRWHNARFKALATEVGITVTKDPRLGWSPTALTADTATAYADTITALGKALRLHRATDAAPVRGPRKTTPPCVCDCGRRIRVAASVLAAGPITCGLCGTDFTPHQPDEKDQP